MDIKKTIDDVVTKVKSDPEIMDKFQKDPVSTVESIIGVDLPNDQIESIISTVKTKISVDKIGGALGGLFGNK